MGPCILIHFRNKFMLWRSFNYFCCQIYLLITKLKISSKKLIMAGSEQVKHLLFSANLICWESNVLNCKLFTNRILLMIKSIVRTGWYSDEGCNGAPFVLFIFSCNRKKQKPKNISKNAARSFVSFFPCYGHNRFSLILTRPGCWPPYGHRLYSFLQRLTHASVRRSMCSDLVYVILFPQLLMVVHFKHHCNTYGSLSAYIVAFFVRLTGGEPMLGLSPMIHYPGWDGERQLFPFRTLAMITSLVTLIGVSWGTKYVIVLTQKYDFVTW